MNFRGCGGEPNRKLFMYHSGWTRDLHEILLMVRETGRYESVVLVGFSLGANMVLKYLGEDPDRVPDSVRGAVALSVPCDLEDSARALARPLCRIYTRYLLGQLREKIAEKVVLVVLFYLMAAAAGLRNTFWGVVVPFMLIHDCNPPRMAR